MLLLALASPAGAEEPFRERLAWYAVPAGLDALSTELAHARGRTEANPFLRDRPLRLALQAASVPALAWLDGRLERWHPALPWILRGIRFAVAGWAIRQNCR